MSDIKYDHTGDIFPGANERQHSYENEIGHPGCLIVSYPPTRSYNDSNYIKYELSVLKVTDAAMEVKLTMRRKDIVEQRIAGGAAVTADIFYVTISFGELVNRIFGPGCHVSGETESFPLSVKEAMKKAYRTAT